MTPAGQTCRSLSKTHRWDGTSLAVGNPRRQPSDTNVLRLVAIQATSARPTTREPSISDVPPLAMGFEKASFKIERAFNNPILLLPRQWSGRAMSRRFSEIEWAFTSCPYGCSPALATTASFTSASPS